MNNSTNLSFNAEYTDGGSIVLTDSNNEDIKIFLKPHTPTFEGVSGYLSRQGIQAPRLPKIKTLRITDPDEFSIPNSDPRTTFTIGEYVFANSEYVYGRKPYILDLNSAPHTLISGEAGGGKTVLLRNIIVHGIHHPDDIDVHLVDLRRVEVGAFAPYLNRGSTISNTIDEFSKTLESLRQEISRRYTLMEESDTLNFTKLPGHLKAQYLVIDEFAQLSEEMSDEDRHTLSDILRVSRAAGVFVFLSTQRPDFSIFKNLNTDLGRRILVGRANPVMATSVLGGKLQFPEEIYQSHRGLATVREYSGVQELVNVAFFPFDLLK